jgi:hypothetical protein
MAQLKTLPVSFKNNYEEIRVIDTWNVVYLHNQVLFSSKKKNTTDTCSKMQIIQNELCLGERSIIKRLYPFIWFS